MNLVELQRLIHNLLRLGTIAEVDHARARVRVKSGELLTAWLPWLESRAGTTRSWSPPTVGEQVMLFSPGGDPAAGVVLTGLFSNAHTAPANSADLWRWDMPDGALLEYNHVAHHLQATLPGSATLDAQGAVTVTAGGGATINADTVINGNVTINGDFAASGGAFTHEGVNVGATHKHGGVTGGNSKTGVPA